MSTVAHYGHLGAGIALKGLNRDQVSAALVESENTAKLTNVITNAVMDVLILRFMNQCEDSEK